MLAPPLSNHSVTPPLHEPNYTITEEGLLFLDWRLEANGAPLLYIILLEKHAGVPSALEIVSGTVDRTGF